MTVRELKMLKPGDGVFYTGMRVVDPDTGRVLLDCPSGPAYVSSVGMYGVMLNLPANRKATVVEADAKALTFYRMFPYTTDGGQS